MLEIPIDIIERVKQKSVNDLTSEEKKLYDLIEIKYNKYSSKEGSIK